MKKISNDQLLWNVLAVLCLLECMFPSSFNYTNVRARSSRDNNGKLLDLHTSVKKFGRHSNDKLWNLAVDLYENDWLSFIRQPRVIQTYIFTEFQPLAPQAQPSIRTLNGSDLTHAPSGLRNEPSLEDIDLIDYLWRQDIDEEKGMYASVQPPENQVETDLQMLSEKSFTQTRMVNVGNNNNSLQSYENYLKSLEDDYLASQKNFDGFDPYVWTDSHMYPLDAWDEKQQFVQLQKTLDKVSEQQEQPAAVNLDNRLSINQSSLTNGTNFEGPLNDLVLTSATVNTSDYNGLEPLLSIFDEPDSSSDLMDWNIPQTSPSSNLGLSNLDNFAQTNFNVLPPLSLATATNDVDLIQTPNLELSPNDITRLFSDRQVAQDLADAYNRRRDMPSVSSVASTSSPVNDSLYSRSTPSSFGQQLNEFDYNEGDLLAEFFMPDPVRSSSFEKFVSLPVTQFPDYDGPSTSYAAAAAASAASDGTYGRYCDTNDSKSVIDHDHHYCSATTDDDGIVEVVVGTSPDAYEEHKIMPTMVFPLIKKQADDECSEYDDEDDGASSSIKSPFEYLHASARDEELAAKNKLPFTASEIINMPATRFGQLLKDPAFSAEQADLIRKIRRRGRNKVAAQNCRQRRIDDEQQLRTEVHMLQQERDALARRRQQILKMTEAERKRLRDSVIKNNHKRS